MIKLADLGIARLMDSSDARTYAGTLVYMSPEQFRCNIDGGSYSYSTDVWLVLYALNSDFKLSLILVYHIGLLVVCYTSCYS